MLEILKYIGVFFLGLFTSVFLPKYMGEKGKNLATKEDVGEITHKTEDVKNEFKKEFDKFSRENKFQFDYYYNQFSELYAPLYAIVSQSEYYRYFNKVYGEKKAPFEEFPFFEINKSRINIKSDLFNGEILEKQTIKINDSITKFNKKEISEYIISNSRFASRKLLKLAVAYRFANDHYSSDKGNIWMVDEFNKEELKLIRELVKIIIKDYNELAKKLQFKYSESELETGIFEDNDFDCIN